MSDDANTQPQNDLPASWPIKTSSDATVHHEDLPLFPPVAEKKAVLSPIVEPVIEAQDLEMLPSGKEEELLEAGTEEPLLYSATEENLLDDGLTDPELYEGNTNDISNTTAEDRVDEVSEPQEQNNTAQNEIIGQKEEIILEPNKNIEYSQLEPVQANEENFTSSPLLPKNEEKIEPNIEIKEVVQETSKINLFTAKSPISDKEIFKKLKVLPVPHAKIEEPIGNDHPLTKPPQVIPFSTPAPSVHTKVAAVYTQPGAGASAWLPWMRTSMWSRKAVKKATRNPEITIESTNLPMITKEPKPNVVYNPVYIHTNTPNIAPKVETTFEPKAPVVRMEVGTPALKQELKPEVAPIDIAPPIPEPVIEQKPKPEVKIKINDALDAAFFWEESEPEPVVVLENAIKAVKEDVMKPKIDNSFDAVMFG